MSPHVCTAQCWAYLLRHGHDENTSECDAFAAFTAAAEEAAA